MGRRGSTYPDNPWVYLILIVLALTILYTIFKIILVPLVVIVIFSFIGMMIGVYFDEEDFRNLCGLVFVISFIVLMVVFYGINFFENHELGKTIINSGENMIGSAGNYT
ncbi:hypothetical protein [uncultured Methanolobus sp.]|uniref:hypothetical protein n=1 Tax=uncultured Methanolobus sp. TaxID=218300 RepID=UPI002AAA7BC4|nr:hypothetical protein [uncultured Methanolobus sp.]